jgi:hypothetical protein
MIPSLVRYLPRGCQNLLDHASVDVLRPSHRVSVLHSHRQADRLLLSHRTATRQSGPDAPQNNGPWFGPDEAANLQDLKDACADL